MSESISGLSRRRLLVAGLGLVGTATLWGTDISGVANAAMATDTQWRGKTSANGWPIIDKLEKQKIEGTDVVVPVLEGDVAIVLLHVARRFHYEIDALRPDAPEEITGHITFRKLSQPYESNYLSGTAIAIRAGSYPIGVQGGFFPHELTVIRDVLAECEGIVRWGGDDQIPKESHFQIDVKPGDKRLKRLAEKIGKWNRTPGEGAGSVDPFRPERLRLAKAMERQQSRT